MKRFVLGWAVALAVAGAGVAGCQRAGNGHETAGGSRAPSSTPAPAPSARREWARSIKRPGLPNLHQVATTLFRGAQPTAKGFRELKRLGVRTVINLRTFHDDRTLLGDTGLNYEHIHIKAWHAEDEDVVRFLRLATDPELQPVFVHCQHGADRTGIACAAYRIVVQGWTREQALDEMTQGDFGFHPAWQNLVEYVRDLDVESIRRQASIDAPSSEGAR